MGLPHVCLNMLCFCILKRIGIATLFSQLWILNNFEKKIIKKGWKILDFRELDFFPKIFKILKKSRENLRFFLLKIILKIKNFRFFEISKFSKFLIFHMIFNRKNLRFFSRFFQDFENFRKKSNFFANARIEKKMIYFQLSLMRYKWFLEVFLASGQFFDWLESKCSKR